MNKASEAILALRPVTFRYKQEIDPEGIPQFGLMGEDVEKVNPDLVARGNQRTPHDSLPGSVLTMHAGSPGKSSIRQGVGHELLARHPMPHLFAVYNPVRPNNWA